MGRFARGVVTVALSDPELELTLLLERSSDEPALRRAYAGRSIRIAASGQARAAARYDAVWYPWNGMRFVSAAPALVTLHDVFAFSEPARGFVARLREQAPIRRAARRAARLATDSRFSREAIVRILGVSADRITVVGLTPDPYFVPGPRRPPLELAGRRFVLFVAGPEPRKNAAFFFDAAARALQRRDEVLALVGTLGAADELALRDARVEHVRFDADDALLRDLYRSAAVVCIPSLAEGFGLVAAEALACGAAVIASSASSLPEVVGDAGLLVDPRDPAAWVRALGAVVADPALADRLKTLALKRFPLADRDRPARETLALLRGLARN